jgi:hypothetical protein
LEREEGDEIDLEENSPAVPGEGATTGADAPSGQLGFDLTGADVRGFEEKVP